MKKKSFAVNVAICVLALASLACSLVLPRTAEPLKFNPDSLEKAALDTAYRAEITITGNETPAGDIYISEGELPPGLEFEKAADGDRATISGTPTAAGVYAFTVYVWCYGTNVSGEVGEKKYTIEVE